MTTPAPPSTEVTATVRREPKRPTTGPLEGSASTDPAAGASSTSPSSRGVRPSLALTAGIREAQLAKAKPLIANAAYVARTAAVTTAARAWRPRGRAGAGARGPRGVPARARGPRSGRLRAG